MAREELFVRKGFSGIDHRPIALIADDPVSVVCVYHYSVGIELAGVRANHFLAVLAEELLVQTCDEPEAPRRVDILWTQD